MHHESISLVEELARQPCDQYAARPCAAPPPAGCGIHPPVPYSYENVLTTLALSGLPALLGFLDHERQKQVNHHARARAHTHSHTRGFCTGPAISADDSRSSHAGRCFAHSQVQQPALRGRFRGSSRQVVQPRLSDAEGLRWRGRARGDGMVGVGGCGRVPRTGGNGQRLVLAYRRTRQWRPQKKRTRLPRPPAWTRTLCWSSHLCRRRCDSETSCESLSGVCGILRSA